MQFKKIALSTLAVTACGLALAGCGKQQKKPQPKKARTSKVVHAKKLTAFPKNLRHTYVKKLNPKITRKYAITPHSVAIVSYRNHKPITGSVTKATSIKKTGQNYEYAGKAPQQSGRYSLTKGPRKIELQGQSFKQTKQSAKKTAKQAKRAKTGQVKQAKKRQTKHGSVHAKAKGTPAKHAKHAKQAKK